MANKRIRIHPYSSAVTPLQMLFNDPSNGIHDTEAGIGTGFFWRYEGHHYLVTNWHNFSGINPFTRKHISKTAIQPNKVRFDMYRDGDINQRVTGAANLFTDGKPGWLVHPKFGNRVDVVCQLINPSDLMPICINDLRSDDIRIGIGSDVFILGYPMGENTARMPIWKRGSIASEPDFNVKDLPMMYVDSATARGMSGSPVIYKSDSGTMADGARGISAGDFLRFLGVYSGRVSPVEQMEAHLGIVWKPSVIEEIFEGRQMDEPPADWL